MTYGGAPDSIDLSEQQLVSCNTAEYGFQNRGCSGGSADDAFEYARIANVTTEAMYPYKSATWGTSYTCSEIVPWTSPGNVSVCVWEI